MTKSSFSNSKIKKLTPKDKRYSLSIGNGLTIRVMPSGVKSWVVRIPHNNRVHDITLGHFPEIDKKKASQLARAERQKYDLEPPKGYTFNDAYSLWKSLKQGEIVSYRAEKRRLDKYVAHALRWKQLDQISAPAVIKLIKPIEQSGKRSTAKRCLMRIREIFDLAVCAGYIHHNPMTGITRLFKNPKKVHRLALPWRDLSSVIHTINQDANDLLRLIFMFSLYSMLRPGEVVKIRWDWINQNCLTIPAEEMKMKRAHTVPLSPFAISLLDEIKTNSRNKQSPFVFPGKTSSGHANSQILTNFMRSHSFFKDRLVPHGLRSIARSWMADNRIPYEVAETCLAHLAGSSISRAYQRSDFFEARMQVHIKWSEFIQSCALSSEKINSTCDDAESSAQSAV